MGFEVATQQAIYTKLITNAPLMAIVKGVFDHVAQDSQAFPFVTIGECTVDEWDTDTESGVFCTATIHTWSRQFGRQQTKMIQDAVFAALHRNTWIDRLLISLSIAGYTMPSFVLGLVLVLVFAVGLGWLPSGGDATWQHAILPIITLSLGGAAVLARFTRSAMLEVMGQPYIRTASAKGLVWRRVVLDHAMPNAAIPTLTVIGFMIGSLIAGAVVVESVFSWPGVGRLLVTSVANRDLAVVQSLLLLVATTMVSANLLVDALYGWIDPRVRSGQATQGKAL